VGNHDYNRSSKKNAKMGPRHWKGRGGTERGYGYRWQQASRLFLVEHPLCSFCLSRGYVVAANVTDHIRKHHGPTDPLFWDKANWQALCKRCHDSTKQQLDQRGRARGWDVNGMPIDLLGK
jgi:5-methylcytosine-specific restriction protein A